MAVTYLGSKTVGAVCISIGLALPALAPALSDIVSRVSGLQAQITANLATIVTPPDPAALLASLATSYAELASRIADVVTSVPVAALEANVSLAADVALLSATKDLLASVVSTLEGAASSGGLHAYRVDSTPGSLGAELAALISSGLPGGSGSGAACKGVVLLTESPSTFAALGTVLLTG